MFDDNVFEEGGELGPLFRRESGQGDDIRVNVPSLLLLLLFLLLLFFARVPVSSRKERVENVDFVPPPTRGVKREEVEELRTICKLPDEIKI